MNGGGARGAGPLTRRDAWRLAFLLAAAYGCLVLASFLPYWLDLRLIDGDARAHVLPYILNHPERLGDRLLVDYARAYVPLGYRWLFQTIDLVLPALVVERLVGLLLLVATWALAARLGWQLGGRAGGLAGLLLGVHSGFVLENGYGGLYRGFALPLLLAWASLVVGGRRPAAWALLPVLALFYPQACLVAGLAAALDLAWSLLEERGRGSGEKRGGRWPWRVAGRPGAADRLRAQRRSLAALAACALLTFLALLPIARRPAFMGDFVTGAEALCMPEFWQPYGRVKFFPQPSPLEQMQRSLGAALVGRSHRPPPPDKPELPPHSLAIGAAAGLLALVGLGRRIRRGERRLRPILLLILAALGLYTLARARLFILGWPDRFVDYPLALVALMAGPLAWGALPRARRRSASLRLAAGALLAAPFALAHPLPGHVRDLSVDTRPFQPLFRFIAAELPEDALIAGWPDGAMDALPVYGHRAVLANPELGQPMYRRYYEELRQRLQDSVRAYVATSIDDPVFARLRDRWGVTHLLVEKRVYHPVRPPLILQPFRALAREYYDASDRERHPLYQPPAASRIYEDDRFILVALDQLR